MTGQLIWVGTGDSLSACEALDGFLTELHAALMRKKSHGDGPGFILEPSLLRERLASYAPPGVMDLLLQLGCLAEDRQRERGRFHQIRQRILAGEADVPPYTECALIHAYMGPLLTAIGSLLLACADAALGESRAIDAASRALCEGRARLEAGGDAVVSTDRNFQLMGSADPENGIA